MSSVMDKIISSNDLNFIICNKLIDGVVSLYRLSQKIKKIALHKFSLKTYYLKCLKSVPGAPANISL